MTDRLRTSSCASSGWAQRIQPIHPAWSPWIKGFDFSGLAVACYAFGGDDVNTATHIDGGSDLRQPGSAQQLITLAAGVRRCDVTLRAWHWPRGEQETQDFSIAPGAPSAGLQTRH